MLLSRSAVLNRKTKDSIMSEGVARKPGRPKKTEVEAAIKENGSDNPSKATLDSSSSSAGTSKPKKKLSRSTVKAAPATTKSKETVEGQETSTIPSKKKKSTKKSVQEEPVSGDQDGIEAGKKEPVDTKTKTMRKKAEPKVEGGTSKSSSTASGTAKSKISDKISEKEVSAPKSGSSSVFKSTASANEKIKYGGAGNDATSSSAAKSKAAVEGIQTPAPLSSPSSSKQQSTEPLESETQPESQLSNPDHDTSSSKTPTSGSKAKSSIPPSKILDALASQKTTPDFGEGTRISSQKQDNISKSTKPQQPATSASSMMNTTEPHPANPPPPLRKGATVLDSEAIKQLNSRRGTPESKPADIRATQQYKNAARKYAKSPIPIFIPFIHI